MSGRVPVPLAPILGRERELDAVRSLVRTHRLVTVIGPGGCGKTRLAVEIARDDPNTTFVDLAPLTDPALVLPTVARELGLREAGDQPVVTTLLRHLGERPVLLVLDNLEHLLDAAGDVLDLLTGAAGVRVLATSRAPLRVPGEQVLGLEPLPVPADGVPDPSTPSVALFLDRIGSAPAAHDLHTVAGVCRELDGLPLALELAAGQVGVLGLEATLARIRTSTVTQLPRRGVPDRHRSLAAAIGWSVTLLEDPARRLFARLAVFAGTWTAAAAADVCGEPGEDVVATLIVLVDQSLVTTSRSGSDVRYRMLRTVRDHATGLLRGSGEAAAMRERHAQWCRGIAARVGALAHGGDEVPVLDEADAALDDLRAALTDDPDHDRSLRSAADLYYLWDMRGYLGEGARHLRRLLDRSGGGPAARMPALRALGLLLIWRGEQQAARAALDEASDLAARARDDAGVAWCAGTLAISHFVGGDVDDAVDRAERGLDLARAAGERMALLRTTCGLGLVRWAQGRHAEAVALLEENAAIVVPSPWGGAKATWFLGWFSFLDGDVDRAEEQFRAAAAVFETIGDSRSLPDCWDGLACVAADRGEYAATLRLFETADGLRELGGSRRNPYLREHCDHAERRARDATAGAGRVTAREREVARLIAEGLTNRQIGTRLGISERTAERHAENLRIKLGVGARAQIAAWVVSVPTH